MAVLLSRLSGLQHENLTLKQQVESAQHLASDRAGFDLQDKLNNMISSLKADHDKVSNIFVPSGFSKTCSKK